MCLSSRKSADRERSGHSRSRSGDQSSRSGGRQGDRRSRRYEYGRSPRHGENPDGYDYDPRKQHYPQKRSSRSREYYGRTDPHRRSSQSREYANRSDPHHHSAYRRDGSDYRDRDEAAIEVSRAPRGTRPIQRSGPRPSDQTRQTSRPRFPSDGSRDRDRRPPSYDRTGQRSGHEYRDNLPRYSESHPRPAKPRLPPSRQPTRAQVPPRLRRTYGLPSDLERDAGTRPRGEAVPLDGNTAHPTTSTGFGLEKPFHVVPALSAIGGALGALEGKHTSSGVTADSSYEEDSEAPAEKSWFDELTKREKQIAFDLVELDVERILKRTGHPFLKSFFLTHKGTRDLLKSLPPEEKASIVQYKFGSKEAFSQRLVTDTLATIEEWKEVLPEITYSDFRAAWFIKTRAATLLPDDKQTEAADLEAFHKQALKTTEAEVRTKIADLKIELAKLPKNQQTLAREFVLTEPLRSTYGPNHLTRHRSSKPAE